MVNQQSIQRWNKEFRHASPVNVLAYFLDRFKGKIAFSTSLGMEDQVLTEMISSIDPDLRIFTLDTGRLFPETYDLISRTAGKYNMLINVYFPDAAEVEQMVAEKGVNLFYNSIENRKLCCEVRKLRPLARALEGMDAWITGLRKHQSVTRNNLKVVEWDENNSLLKINPLINWSEQEVKEYVEARGIPVSPLHSRGFASIGCQPCTRAIETGEDVRAGRWWWENPDTKECGLHQR